MDKTPWREVEPFPTQLSYETSRALDRVAEFRTRWQEFVSNASEEDLKARRDMNLRRHAIETGILERLYELDYGITEAFVAEGITLEVAEREGGVTPDALRIISSQLNALEKLVEYVQAKRELSVFFIKELHSAITASQLTYDAHDTLGRPVQAELKHGAWKTSENHVTRPDGSILEYSPAIRVQDQMETLVAQYSKYVGKVDPVALAAWMHHRFICIHPFSDGNGRVARALTLLVLLQGGLSPLVVRGSQREEYIHALDSANDGDLEPLIRLFARLEENALRSELEVPRLNVAGTAIDVAKAYAERLRVHFETSNAERKAESDAVASRVQELMLEMLQKTARELKETFSSINSNSDAWVKYATPPSPESKFWSHQIIRAARQVDFYANLDDGAWWTVLNVRFGESSMRFGAVVQKVGRGETGFLALTEFAESFTNAQSEDDRALPEPILEITPLDSVNLLHTDDPNERWAEIHGTVEKTLSAALNNFLSTIG